MSTMATDYKAWGVKLGRCQVGHALTTPSHTNTVTHSLPINVFSGA